MNKQNNKAAHDFEVIRQVATASNTPIDLRRVQQYSAYLQGAMSATDAIVKRFPQITKGKRRSLQQGHHRACHFVKAKYGFVSYWRIRNPISQPQERQQRQLYRM